MTDRPKAVFPLKKTMHKKHERKFMRESIDLGRGDVMIGSRDLDLDDIKENVIEMDDNMRRKKPFRL